MRVSRALQRTAAALSVCESREIWPSPLRSTGALPRMSLSLVVRPKGENMSGVVQTGDRTRLVRRAPVLVCLGLILVYPLYSVPMQASIHNLVPRIGEIGARAVTEAAIWTYGGMVLA